MTERQPARIPAHVFVMLSASTAVYALVLAGVAGVQSRDDAALAAARDPVARAIEQVAAGHDELGDRLDRARAGYAAAAQAYGAAGGAFTTLHGHLDALAAAVAKVDGVSRSLPTTIRLPSVRSSVSGGGAPTTHATTRASGG
ncbi:MAG TPA: hypothetical protein VL749_08165 [Patescibacteria group bacterium]|nr:hypothetical protein [Patescibacteria group bacterium]